MRVPYDLRWQTVRGSFARFEPGRNLRAVISVPFAKGVRLTRREAAELVRRRLSGRRSRLKRWMGKALLILERLQAFSDGTPQRRPPEESPIRSWFIRFRKHLRRVATVEEATEAIRAVQQEVYEKFLPRRELAVQLGGVATERTADVEAALARLDEALKVERPPSQWVPASAFIYGLIIRPPYNLTAVSWDEEVRLVMRKYARARPHNVIRVHENDALAHPQGSANLLIYDEELSDRDLDLYRANSFAMYAVCQLTQKQDRILDRNQRFTNSPALAKSPVPKLKEVQSSRPGRYVLLACPVVIRRGPRDKDKTYREAHDFLFSVPRRPIRKGAPSFIFGGQVVWREIFQRFYWDKGLYVIPRLFLGYTPRGGTREMGPGRLAE